MASLFFNSTTVSLPSGSAVFDVASKLGIRCGTFVLPEVPVPQSHVFVPCDLASKSRLFPGMYGASWAEAASRCARRHWRSIPNPMICFSPEICVTGKSWRHVPDIGLAIVGSWAGLAAAILAEPVPLARSQVQFIVHGVQLLELRLLRHSLVPGCSTAVTERARAFARELRQEGKLNAGSQSLAQASAEGLRTMLSTVELESEV